MKELDSTAISFLFKTGSGAESEAAGDIVVGVQYTLPMELAVMLLYVMGADDDVDVFCK